MREVLYTKYNSLRKPEYQISTSIYLEDGQKYVEKKAISKSAVAHMDTLSRNADIVGNLYTNTKILLGEKREKSIVYPFLEGKSLLSDVDVEHTSFQDIVQKLKKVLDKINQYNSSYVKEFEMTLEFAAFFGEVTLDREPAISISNLDGIFGNFIEMEDGSMWCIDCEWVVEFPVPIRFISYRCLQYYYIENYIFLRNKAEETEFIKAFGFSDEDLQVFGAMERAFQQKIFGEHHEYVYVNNYKKTSQTFDFVLDKNRDLERIVAEQQAYIERMQKAIKNPLYAGKIVAEKVKAKFTK